MTAYVTASEFASLGPTGSLVTFTTGEIEDAILVASAEADDYLACRYTLPLTAWPVSLKKHVSAIAARNLMRNRGMNPESEEAFDRPANEAVKWLAMVADGRLAPQGVTDSKVVGDAVFDVSLAISLPTRTDPFTR